MKIKSKDLVQVKSIFDPNIVVIKEVVKNTKRSRQFVESTDLTFGIISSVGVKVIIIDNKYHDFIDKCKKIDKTKNLKK